MDRVLKTRKGFKGALSALGAFVVLLGVSFPAFAEPGRVSLQAEKRSIELKTSLAASLDTAGTIDFGYLVEGMFLDLGNPNPVWAPFVFSLQNLPGTTVTPMSGMVPPFGVKTVVIFTDRSNVPAGEYSGTIYLTVFSSETLVIPMHYFVADTILCTTFTPPQDSVLAESSSVHFGQNIFFTLWTKNSAAVTWKVNNSSNARISRNFAASLTFKGVWSWDPADDVVIPAGSPTVTSVSSLTPTGNPVTDDYFSVTYMTTGGLPATTRGDLNGDGFLTAADVVLEENLVFLGMMPPAQPSQGDVNCDNGLTPADVVMLLNKTFLNSGNLCAP